VLGGRRALVSAFARGATDVLHIPSSELNQVLSEQPVLGDKILNAFIARRELMMQAGFEGLRVIGSATSRHSFQLCEFLARNQVPFTWVKVEDDPAIGDLLQDLGVSAADMPVVAYGDRPLLRRPSIRDLAEQVGLRSAPRNEIYDLVIIGAGPAGLAAAVYGASEGLRTLVLDGSAPGGQAGTSTKIENYLGFPTGITGADLMGRAVLQAQKFGAQFSTPSLVAELDLRGPLPLVRIEGGETARTRCVLIATGAEYRRLDVPGRERFDGLGVYYAATQTELVACTQAEVVVVGAGNSAGQAIMYLCGHTRRVTVLVRNGSLRDSMSSYLAERIEAAENVEVLYHTQVRQIVGDERLEAVEIENTQTAERRTLNAAALFSFIGAVPCTGWLPPQLETDRNGFICTGREVADSPNWQLKRRPYTMETTHPGVFAAGDVRVGSTKRVSSAVGEGAMAIKYIHEYLALQESENAVV
jgi:thioredoxin reductase (NADPH)